MDGVETCVGTSGSSGTSVAIRLGYCGMLGSLISATCGGYLALPYPLLGDRHFLPAPYLEFLYLLPLVQYPLLGIPLLLHLNWRPLMGFIPLQ